MLFLDGAYRFGSCRARFQRARSVTSDDLAQLLDTLSRRIVGLLERLCRYITRPPIATKRLSIDDHGRVVYRYKRPYRDSSTHVVLEPMDFMARLAALISRPRLNLTRFHSARTAGTHVRGARYGVMIGVIGLRGTFGSLATINDFSVSHRFRGQPSPGRQGQIG
jgi:hypothetical protein